LNYIFPKKKKSKVKPQAASINVGMKEVFFIDNEEQKRPLNTIRLLDAEYGEYFPLIPYIFYDINETELPQEYIKEKPVESLAGSVDEEQIAPQDAIEASYQLLDIVAQRMVDNPHYTLTITGTIDNRFETDRQTSEDRAKNIKSYLLKNYNIGESRLIAD